MKVSRPPDLSKQERLENSQLAIKARRDRAAAKTAIASREISIFDLIADKNPAIQRMRVFDLLVATPGVGSKRAAALMTKAKISPSRRIAGLGRHQINALKDELVLNKQVQNQGLLVVMSGPGGVGKSTISAALRNEPNFWLSVSATTRAPREGEIHGKDYFFISDLEFDQMVSAGKFLEWAEFAGARYGTLREPVIEALNTGKNVILEIEIQGARQVKQAMPEAIMVFIAPPSISDLLSRLENRGTDTPERIAARIALAEEELAAASEFNHVLVNHRVDEVVGSLLSLAALH